MKKSNRLTYIVAAMLAFVLCLITFAGVGGVGRKAYAATSTGYSSVIQDLTKDPDFNLSEYPENSQDMSLNVIQVAEGEHNELFVYVYQPCGNLTATSIRISTAINDSLFYDDYKLTLINSWGVFFKYKVNDFMVKPDMVRYYDISAISRKWDSSIDSDVDNDNTVNEVSYEVGHLWTVVTLNGEVTYSKTDTETILITDKYLGFMRYTEGYWLWRDACDSHYVAFSTDHNMERLEEADLYYVSREVRDEVTYNIHGDKHNYKYWLPVEKPVRLSEIDEGHTSVTGLGGTKHTWQRIQTVSDFISTEKLTSEAKSQLSGKEWILRFADTDYKRYANMGIGGSITGYTDYYTEVSEVTILRLKFETDGKVYNLGVVDNKQTGDLKPDNPQPGDPAPDKGNGFWDKVANFFKSVFKGIVNFFKKIFGGFNWRQWLLLIVALIFLVPLILSIFFAVVRKLVLIVLKAIGNALLWVICLPFRLLKKLFGGGE